MAESIDRNSPTWRLVRDHAARRIEGHRTALENPALDHDASNVLRGRIKELRELLRLDPAASADEMIGS